MFVGLSIEFHASKDRVWIPYLDRILGVNSEQETNFELITNFMKHLSVEHSSHS